MTVSYDCAADVSELTAEDLNALTNRLDKERYDWYYDGDTLTIQGECEVDDYGTNANDVAREIDYILWSEANLDADIKTEEVEYEPDWDKMPGGYDYIWN